MRSLSNLGAAQAARTISAPGQVVAPSPAREALLEGVRRRNAVLDYLFYDLGTLKPDEATRLAPRYAAEGAILVVGPRSAPTLDVWPDAQAFLATGPQGIDTIAVAGVGSSALGAAAFARNVADALGRPVLSVVSGYGLSDLVTEAIGGFFWFGQLNSLRHVFEPIDNALRPTRIGSGAFGSSLAGPVRKSLDVRTLVALLASPAPVLRIVGHSKGNLVISEALFALREIMPERVAQIGQEATLVTVSARVAMPRQCRRVIDIMGALDGFGELNSRHWIPTDVTVPCAWHHTNTDLPMHLPVTKVLQGALAAAA